MIDYSVKRSKMMVSKVKVGRIHSIISRKPVIPRIQVTRICARSPLVVTGVHKPAQLIVQFLKEEDTGDKEDIC